MNYLDIIESKKKINILIIITHNHNFFFLICLTTYVNCKNFILPILFILQGVARLMRILHCAENVALNNALFTYDKVKKWFSICDTLKQVRLKKND